MNVEMQRAMERWAGLVPPIEVDAAPFNPAASPPWWAPVDVDAAPGRAVGPLRVVLPVGAPVVVRLRR